MGVKTEKKDQAALIAELISRVTSLEEDMEFVLNAPSDWGLKHKRPLTESELKVLMEKGESDGSIYQE